MRFRTGLLALSLAPWFSLAAVSQTAPERLFQPAPLQIAKAAPPLRGPSPDVSPPTVRGIEPVNDYGLEKIGFSNGVTGLFDLTYATVPGFRPLTLDLYTPPPRPGGPLPLIVFVHGGGWNGGDSRHSGTFEDFPATLAALAAQGYVVASVNYRLSGEAVFPAPLQDVKSAIRWLRGQANARGIDPTRVAAWGAAAGGQLAALTGVSCGVARFEPESDTRNPPSDCVEAVIDWYGVSDLESLAADAGGAPVTRASFSARSTTAEGDYLGCEPADCAPALARLASPLAFITNMTPPFLIQHGAADQTVPPKQSQKLYDALREKSVPAEIVLYPGVGHDFTRGGNADPALNTQAITRLAAFLATKFPAGVIARATPSIRANLPD